MQNIWDQPAGCPAYVKLRFAEQSNTSQLDYMNARYGFVQTLHNTSHCPIFMKRHIHSGPGTRKARSNLRICISTRHKHFEMQI